MDLGTGLVLALVSDYLTNESREAVDLQEGTALRRVLILLGLGPLAARHIGKLQVLPSFVAVMTIRTDALLKMLADDAAKVVGGDRSFSFSVGHFSCPSNLQ